MIKKKKIERKETVITGVSFLKEYHDIIKQLAVDESRSQSSVINILVREALIARKLLKK